MTRLKIKKFICDFMDSQAEAPAMALMCDNEVLTAMMRSIASEVGESIVVLPAGKDKIAYKRMLNNCGAQLLIYTTSYEDTVWEILNDGTTPVVETLEI